jgi:hypothetical protein
MNDRANFKSNFVGYAAVALTLGVAVAPVVASADGPPAPPEEAYSACDSKKLGDECTVTLHDHTHKGTCDQRESDTRLSCRPAHPPIPQAAFDACNGKAAGDTCSVTFDGHSIDGTCVKGPGDGLSCRPSGPPPR